MIPQHLARIFPPLIKSRGKEYFDSHRVSDLKHEGNAFTANVRGTSTYAVRITIRYNVPSGIRCECPYFEDHSVCKHTWALLLAVDAQNGFPRKNAKGVVIEDDPLPTPTPTPTLMPSLTSTRIPTAARAEGASAGSPHIDGWHARLQKIQQPAPGPYRGPGDTFSQPPIDTPLTYRVDAEHLRRSGELVLTVGASDGGTRFTDDQWRTSAIESDRTLAYLLLGASASLSQYYQPPVVSKQFIVPRAMLDVVFKAACDTGRCLVSGIGDTRPLVWDGERTWQPHLIFTLADEAVLRCTLVRGDRKIPLEDVLLITAHGVVLIDSGESVIVTRAVIGDTWPIVLSLRTGGPIRAPLDAAVDMALEIRGMPGGAHVEMPDGPDVDEYPDPVPHLHIDDARFRYERELPARLSFEYDGMLVDHNDTGGLIPDRVNRRILHRDESFEHKALAFLEELGAKPRPQHWQHNSKHIFIPNKVMPALVPALLAERWVVRMQGSRYRIATRQEARVSSGIDWFEIEGGVAFDAEAATIPELLAALQRGETTIALSDGSIGIIPVDWLRRFQTIASMSAGTQDGAIRLQRAQAGILDILLAEHPDTDVDATFAHIRDELRTFTQIEPEEAPSLFQGELRTYQKDALGWFSFLRRLGVGGCLADDMGLGKTVQVLALLESRRLEKAGPSLVVVPKSLVFNWISEAARFTPQLRVLDYTGGNRNHDVFEAQQYDLVISTYGTLRRDARELTDVAFDYVILDEAQAIKNAKTASAKAARVLRAKHRLALSGTPIENDLSELWSLFEFLNPGMLGASIGAGEFRAGASRDTDAIALLAKAVRPFMLRRTKEQVAPELPTRTEQTLIVELDTEQRKLYDSLRDHYRSILLQRVDNVGIKRSKIEILEALLRLRQAAIHPGLIDAARRNQPSAKLDMLMEQLSEVIGEGHRALVFSQFTTVLSMVATRLRAEGITFEYLDGKTRDRQARVEHFQNDSAVSVFLISLRAGGQGLNLTAADYVFVLDPWWNPAVEAQAIDRAHRIGQDKHVIALRLIARDTVEEKVIELQQSKRALADAILGADAGLISSITREDLELLLGG